MEERTNHNLEASSMSRVAKNSELYKKINDEELSNYTVRSNATVLGNQEPEIDIEKIKKILDTRYNSAPQRKSIRIEQKEEEPVTYDDTKEYDINAVIEKAKSDKTDDYEEARAKKLRDTQYNILNNLQLDDEKEETRYTEKKQEELMELINTITLNAEKQKEIKEFDDEETDMDLFDDLKGDGDTQVYGSMSEEIKELTLEQPIVDSIDNVKNEEPKKEKKKAKTKEEKVDDSFYTNSLVKKKDFEDDEKLFDDSKYNIWIKILVGLVIVAFLVGLFLFLKSFLNF